ncbi:MAG: TfoX/Sxy family protein [Bacteroidales bacterium]|nr:TfoX/Sxy family protein [Bacteroidales bacterium]
MASNTDFVQYIVDQCSGAGDIAVKKMMGDYCIYCNGILFGLICDNNLFVKVTEPGRAVLREEILRPPYPGAREYFYITDVDDSDYLEKLVRVTLPALADPRAKKPAPVAVEAYRSLHHS